MHDGGRGTHRVAAVITSPTQLTLSIDTPLTRPLNLRYTVVEIPSASVLHRQVVFDRTQTLSMTDLGGLDPDRTFIVPTTAATADAISIRDVSALDPVLSYATDQLFYERPTAAGSTRTEYAMVELARGYVTNKHLVLPMGQATTSIPPNEITTTSPAFVLDAGATKVEDLANQPSPGAGWFTQQLDGTGAAKLARSNSGVSGILSLQLIELER